MAALSQIRGGKDAAAALAGFQAGTRKKPAVNRDGANPSAARLNCTQSHLKRPDELLSCLLRRRLLRCLDMGYIANNDPANVCLISPQQSYEDPPASSLKTDGLCSLLFIRIVLFIYVFGLLKKEKNLTELFLLTLNSSL